MKMLFRLFERRRCQTIVYRNLKGMIWETENVDRRIGSNQSLLRLPRLSERKILCKSRRENENNTKALFLMKRDELKGTPSMSWV